MPLLTLCACRGPEKTNQSNFEVDTPTDDSGREDMEVVDLTQFDQWEILGEEFDPYPDHRTPEYTCDSSGILPEDLVLEINTNDCGYAIVGQPLQADIQPGDLIELLMYHSALSSTDEAAEGHFSLMVGERVFWEKTIPIPWNAEVYLVPIITDWSAEAGTMVRIHLHNHGGNSWRVGYLKRVR